MQIGNKLLEWLKELDADGFVFDPLDGDDDKPCLCEYPSLLACEGRPECTFGVLGCEPMKVLIRNEREEPIEWEVVG